MMRAVDYRKRALESQTEAQFQEQVIKLARALGWNHYHTHDSRRSPSGFPDLVLTNNMQRRVIYRELKREKGGRVSPAQKEWITNLETCGQDVDIWRPSDLESGRIFRELQGH